LPACCRRHGSHHCALSGNAMALRTQAASGSGPILVAPARCPFFPASNAVPASNPLALAVRPSALPVQLVQTLVPPSGRAAVRLNQVSTRTGRAPPATSLA
jgi:hypothetical protein